MHVIVRAVASGIIPSFFLVLTVRSQDLARREAHVFGEIIEAFSCVQEQENHPEGS